MINCHSDATVRGGIFNQGGIAGENGGSVINCHSSATVSGEDNVGGLIGRNLGTVNDSFSGGKVYGSRFTSGSVPAMYSRNLGGLVGSNRL